MIPGLGFKDWDQELLKAKLTLHIHRLPEARKFTEARGCETVENHPAASFRLDAPQAGIGFHWAAINSVRRLLL
jgi:hypothetical protein